MAKQTITIDPPIIPGQPKGLRFEIIHSLAEFGELAQITKKDTHDSKWAGGTFDEALDMAAHGWDEPLPDVEAITDALAPTLVFTPTMDVSGCEVDIDLYLQGEPECMRDFPMAERQVASVSVLVPVCYSSWVDEESVRKRGIAIAAALEELRSQGVAVTVYAYLMIGGRYETIKYKAGGGLSPISVSLVRLADTRMAYDLGRITYAVGHPTMLRQLFFAYEDGWTADDKRCWGIGNHGGRGWLPYSFDDIPNHRDNRQEEITSWVTGQLDTEITVTISSLTDSHNGWSMTRHMEEIEGYFTQTKDLHIS